MRRLLWAVLLLSGAVWAQERQVVPLRYELWWEERSIRVLGRFDRTASTAAKLPPLTDPQFFVARFGGGERLFVLANRDGELVLLVDTDGDNDLTDERPFSLRQRGPWRMFGPIPMRVQVNGRTVIRYIGAMVQKNEKGENSLYLVVASVWKGTVLWAGNPVPITVIDDDADGLVGESDTVELGDGPNSLRLPVSGRLSMDGRFARFHITPAGDQLVLEPIEVPSAIVRVQGDEVMLTVEGDDGQWILVGRNGQVPAPVGEFRLVGIMLSRRDAQGQLWRLSAHAFGPAAPKITIPAAGTTLTVEPLKVALIWDRKGNEVEFSLDIKTANGLSVNEVWVNFQRPPEPKLRLVANGKVIDEPKFHYG